MIKKITKIKIAKCFSQSYKNMDTVGKLRSLLKTINKLDGN